jgi:hypothetical protein
MQGMDWNYVFAPTVRYTTLRAILAHLAHHDYEIEQMDVVTTLLNADVVSEVYMEQPLGFTTISPDGHTLVCKLKKALYGIREAPRACNTLLSDRLISTGFTQSKVDPVVYTIISNQMIYIFAVYVDDCLLVVKLGPFIASFKRDFASRFQIEDSGPTALLLGCTIERDRPRFVGSFAWDRVSASKTSLKSLA